MRLTAGIQTRPSSLLRASIWRNKVSALVSVLVCLTVVGYLATNFASSKATAPRQQGAVTVHAAGRGNPWINLQDGRDLPTVYKGRNVAQALLWNAANPLTLASADFDEDGVPDLVVGYSGGSGGALSIYRGNINAFAPQTEEMWRAVTEMRYPDPFFPEARTIDTVLPAQFLGTGDFNSDGHQDLVIAAQGTNILELFVGDGRGKFTAADVRYLPGTVTSMLTDDIGTPDGLADLAVGVVGASGPAILVFNGRTTLSSEPATYQLSKPATALTSGRLAKDGSVVVVAAAENEIVIVHGADRQEAARIERFNLPFKTLAITLGRFIWDREGSQGVAALGDDGAVHLLTAGRLDTRPYTQDEMASIRDNRFKYGANSVEFRDFLKTLIYRPDKSRDWIVAESVLTGVSEPGNNSSPALLIKAGVSAGLVDDLAVVDSGNKKLHVIRNRQIPTVPDESNAKAETNAAQTPVDIPLDVDGAPVALMSMRLNVDTLPDLVVLRQGQKDPGFVITAPLTTYVVNSTADAVDASPGNNVCATSGGVCTLRAAIMEANHHVGPDTITLPAGTYQLTIANPAVTPSGDNERLLTQGGHEEYADLDIIDFDGDDTQRSDLTINGAAPGTTFIQAGTTATNGIDRAIDINNPKVSQGDKAIAVNINNVTVRFSIGQIVDVPLSTNDILEKGAGIQFNGFTLIGSAGPTTLALTLDNCVVTSNTASGLGGGIHSEAGSLVVQNGSVVSLNTCNGGSGGGIDYAGGNTYIGQLLTISNSTIGGAGAGNSATPIAAPTPFTNEGPLSGGGVATFGGSTVTITGSTIQGNVSNDATGAGSSQQNTGGGGLFLTGNPAVTITGCTITGNTAKNNAGGIYAQLVNSLTNVEGTATINNTQITSNTADSDSSGDGNGGGIYNHRGAITIGNATACNINSNTADDGGGIYLTWNLQTLDTPPSVTMTNGTLNSNNARNNGGGIAVNFEATTADASNKTATTTLTGVTLQSNTANSDSSGGGDGGAIFDNGNGGTFAMPVSLNGATTTIDSNVANGGSGDGFRLNGGTLSASGTLNVNSGDSLYIAGGTFNSTSGTCNLTGNFTRDNGSTFNANGGTFNFNGSSTQNINGTATGDTFNNFIVNKTGILQTGGSTTSITTNDLTMTAGTFTAPATLDINGNTLLSAGTLTAGANITAAGNWTNNGGTFTPGSGTVTFDGGAAQAINGSATPQTFNNVTVNKTGTLTSVNLITNNLTMSAGTFTAPASLDINGNTLLSAGTLTAGTNITAAGDWTNDGGTFTPGANTVTFDGAGTQSLKGTAGTQTFNNFVVNKGNTLTGAGSLATLTLNGSLTLTAGGFTAGTITNIGLPGNWTNNGGTFTPSSSTVTFNGGVAQAINGSAASETFNNLTVNKSANALSTALSLTINNLTMTLGAFNPTTLDINGNTLLTAGTLTPGANITAAGDWTNDGGTFTPGSNTVTFDGAGAQQLKGTAATQTFNNFVVNKGNTLTAAGSLATLNINNDLTITAGTFATGATLLNVNVTRNWANSGTFTPGASNTVVFNGTGAGTQTMTGTTSFTNLTLNHTGGGGLTSTGTLTVTGLMRVQAGTFTTSSTFANVQIDAGTTLVSDGSTINLSGNWTNNGTFTPSTGTVNFNGGAAQVISGAAATQTFNNVIVNKGGGALSTGANPTTLTMNNLTMTLGTFTAPATLNVGGNLLLNGGLLTGGATTNITGNVQLNGGTLTAGANTNVTGNWTKNAGAFTAGSNTVTFNGAAGQTIDGTTATTFNNLTNSNAGGISMNNDNTVNAVLALTSSDITVAATKTLTQPLAGTSSGTFDVNGRVQRNGFVTGGATLSFGNPNNQIKVTAGTAPANIVVDLARSVPGGAIGFPTAVQRTYTITPSANGFTGTLRLHYLPGELNGNTANLLNLWRFDNTLPTPGWRPNQATSRDCASGCDTNTSAFWVEKTLVTQFSPWTLNSTNAPTAGSGTISGRVTREDGTGVAGAVVNLNGSQSRKTISDAQGNYRFADVTTDGFYTVTPTRANYEFSPASRSFSQLGNNTDATFTGTLLGDNANPLDTAEYFVRQQYVDILGREPDEAGFNYWSNQILACNGDQDCTRSQRVGVAAAFFIENEFRQSGAYIYDVYESALGRRPAYAEYSTDRTQVVGGSTLDAQKQQFAAAFVGRAEFLSRYENNLSADSFVDALLANAQTAGINLSSQRDSLISRYNAGTSLTESRAFVLRDVSESTAVRDGHYNAAFVVVEYFGYLHRGPDQGGYEFWLNVLNTGDPGNYRGMVCSFVTSAEYQRRFSAVVSHSNGECGGQ